MKVKVAALGKRNYVGRDDEKHVAYTIVANDGENLIGFTQIDGQAPVIGLETEVNLSNAFQVRKPWTPGR